MVRWQQDNETYLTRALTWLRLRLTRLAESGAPETPPSAGGGSGWFRHKSQPAPEGVSEADVTQAAAALDEAEAGDPPPVGIVLSHRFGLSRFEFEVLLLCAALELDTRIAGLCARAQNNPNRTYPTFALAMALFDDPTWEALSPERPLRYWRLIEINQPGAQPLTTSALRADERIISYLKGLNYLDDRPGLLLVPFEQSSNRELPPSQQAAVENILHHLRHASPGRLPVVQVVGPDALSKQLVARHAAAHVGVQLYRLPAEMLPQQATELETFARLWERESLLLPIGLYLDTHETDGDAASDGQKSLAHRFLARSGGLLFLDSREGQASLGRDTFAVDVTKPSQTEQRAAWLDALGTEGEQSPARLASQFNLNLATIYQVAQTIRDAEPADTNEMHEWLWSACLRRTRPQLDKLAQRLDPRAVWDDIVLPDEQMTLLRQIAAQVSQRTRVYDEWGFRAKMNRGLGINVLFAGPSGSGKTMAAEVLAKDLRLNLYRIDLSAVVSKYIGETEKNLRKLFDAAEDGGAILFFDEADALFGKRSEVKDSHDRYANIEINYLLQRMESYRGLAVLATNMRSALDQAFLRRLRFIVDFPFPGRHERKRIWAKAFPAETPTAGLDYGRLSRLNLTGGSIHNIALNAAFLAAETDEPITMPVLLAAARAEFVKLERPINEADFHWAEPGLSRQNRRVLNSDQERESRNA
jgi:hypothetical protein